MREYCDAVRLLTAVVRDRRHLDDAARGQGSAFAAEIAYGVVRHYFSLGEWLGQLMAKPLAEKHLDIRLLLLAGLHSIARLRRPPHASVNAAVAAAAALGKPWAKALVNGVLRNALRQGGEGGQPAAQSLEAQLDHPRWLIDALRAAWPGQDVLAANNTRAPMTLRVNLARSSREAMMQTLAEAGLASRAGRLSPAALLLAEPQPVERLPGFAEGLLSVQDEAAQLAAGFLDLRPGQRALDACAAPGGKACHILETCPEVQLSALDPDKQRLALVEQNLKRLCLTADCQPLSLLDLPRATPGFDRILLDAPCSATGVIRRHPDIKLLRQPADIDKLAATQRELLARAFDLLNPNGELVYATCSALPQENDQAVQWLLAARPAARLLPLGPPPAPPAPEAPSALATEAGLQLLPTEGSHDGFYYARIGIGKAA